MKDIKAVRNRINIIGGIALLAALNSGCSKQPQLYSFQYVNWVEDSENKMKIEKEMGDVKFIVQFRPIEYIAVLEQNNENITEEKLHSKKKELDGMVYYNLRISSDKSNDLLMVNLINQQEYYKRMDYLSFAFQDDIYLIENETDTVRCGLFNFVRNYGIAPYVDFALGFENKNSSDIKDRTLVVEDRIFGSGILKFNFRKKDIDNIPLLKTN